VTNVLLVDDDPENLWSLQIALEGDGHRVSIADSARRAMFVLRHEPIQFVITDFEMPGIDGAQLSSMIAAEPAYKETPVLLLSAGPEPLHRPHSWVRFLRKPASFADLRDAIDCFAAERLPLHVVRTNAIASPRAVLKCLGASAIHWSGIDPGCWP